MSQDDSCSSMQMKNACLRLLNKETYQNFDLAARIAEKRAQQLTAWRIDGTLREFPKFAPINLWFDYPAHHADYSGVLKDVDPEGEKPFWQKGTENRKKNAKSKREKINSELEIAYASLSINGDVTIKDLAEYWDGMSEKGVKDRVKKSGRFYYENGIVHEKEAEKTGGNE